MNDEQLKAVNTLDRYETDLGDWETLLRNIRLGVDYAENTGDPDVFTQVRREIGTILHQIEQARHFIGVKRSVVAEVAPDVSEIFDGRPARLRGEHQEDLNSQGGDIAE